MRQSNIMFSNLRAEMARKNLTIIQMANILNMNRDTLGKKLSGKSHLYLNEAFEINKKFFPESTVPYLFHELENSIA